MDSIEKPDKRVTVLIVDDEPKVVQLLKTALMKDGHLIVTAGSGNEAIEKAREFPPDLILMDVIMPKMDGYEATIHIKRELTNKDTPIIFLSGKPSEEDGGRGFAVGAAAYLCKPFGNQQIRDVVKLALQVSGHQVAK